MQRKAWIETAVFAGLVLAAAAARITFRELPNFAPIAAMSLFAGYYFRSPLVAIAVPLAAMLLSDMVLGGYEWQMMLVVYGMLVLPVAFRGPLRRWLRIEKGRLGKALARSAGCWHAACFRRCSFSWRPILPGGPGPTCTSTTGRASCAAMRTACRFSAIRCWAI